MWLYKLGAFGAAALTTTLVMAEPAWVDPNKTGAVLLTDAEMDNITAGVRISSSSSVTDSNSFIGGSISGSGTYTLTIRNSSDSSTISGSSTQTTTIPGGSGTVVVQP